MSNSQQVETKVETKVDNALKTEASKVVGDVKQMVQSAQDQQKQDANKVVDLKAPPQQQNKAPEQTKTTELPKPEAKEEEQHIQTKHICDYSDFYIADDAKASKGWLLEGMRDPIKFFIGRANKPAGLKNKQGQDIIPDRDQLHIRKTFMETEYNEEGDLIRSDVALGRGFQFDCTQANTPLTLRRLGKIFLAYADYLETSRKKQA